MTSSRPKEIHIGLLWHSFGHSNLGIDALSRTNHALIKQAASEAGYRARFTVFGGKRPIPADLPQDIHVGAHPGLKDFATGRWEFFTQIKTCDIIFDIGEGDSFTDIYGRKRFALQSITKIAALRQGVPLVLSPQTIGPFENATHRRIANRIMSRARAVFARDHLSRAYLDKNVPQTQVDEFIDVAFALPFETAKPTLGVPRIGVNVSGLLFRGGYSGKNEFGLTIDYAQATRKLLAALLSEDLEVHLFAHVTNRYASGISQLGPEDDQHAIAALVKEFPALKCAPIFPSASAAKSWMSGLDFVVAGRMHACIGAFSSGVPVVPIAYSRKFNGLFESLSYPYFIDAKAQNTDQAVRQILDWRKRSNDLRTAVSLGNAISREKLSQYSNCIGTLMRNIGPGQ